MEQQNQNSIFSELEFDNIARSHIETMAQWALVIAVIGIVTNVVGLAQLFLSPYPASSMSQEGFSSLLNSSLAASKFIGVISIGIALLINVFLYLFARKAKTSSQAGDGNGIGRSFAHLKTYFMIMSIILVIVLVICLLAMLLGGMGAAMR